MMTRRRAVVRVWFALTLAALAAPFARAAAQEDAAESRSAAFQAVEGGQGEQVPGGPLLVAAYAVALLLMVAYVARLGALHAKNRGELERLERALERSRKAG